MGWQESWSVYKYLGVIDLIISPYRCHVLLSRLEIQCRVIMEYTKQVELICFCATIIIILWK